MLKAKICVLVATCAFGATAMAGERPPYHPYIKPIQSVAQPAGERPPYHAVLGTQPAGERPPYHAVLVTPRPGTFSMVISAPRN
jgi:hypothetical protein